MPAKNSKPCSKMNTNPDETKMALWLDDELPGAELAAFEATVGNAKEVITAREDVRRWRSLLAAAVPAAVEPPYPDFFNLRVARAIRVPAGGEPAGGAKWWWLFWRGAVMPVAAGAGMVFTFWLGIQTSHRSTGGVVAVPPRAVAVEPPVYTPENGVEAERFASSPASATVIVLSGVAAIPDDADFSKSTSFNQTRNLDATAAMEPESNDLLEL